MGKLIAQKYIYLFKVLPFDSARYAQYIGVFRKYTKLRNTITHEGSAYLLKDELRSYFVKQKLINNFEDGASFIKKELVTHYITNIRNFIQEIICDLESRTSR